MKTKQIGMIAFKFLVVFTIICGVIYPSLLTGLAQKAFPQEAQGSLITVNNRIYGSELLGQNFTEPKYLWGRPMLNGKASNLSPASAEYKLIIAERVMNMREANPYAKTTQVPVDLVTASGSGVDPHISVVAANYQIPRLMSARQISESEIKKIIDQYTTKRIYGILGEDIVNVLEVNLALDKVK